MVRALVLSLFLALTAPTIAADRPNILFILADDLGYGDVAALNPAGKIKTPNLDRIIHEGMHFTDAHSSSAVCTPTRYSILTGRYHWRSKLQKGVLGGYSRPLIDAPRPTVASFLRDQGYVTACIGKWHLGLDWALKDGRGLADDQGLLSKDYADEWNIDYTVPVQNGPQDRGFDRYFGISASLDMPPFVFIRGRQVVEAPTVEKTWLRKGPAAVGFEAVDVLPKFTAETVQFLKERAEPAAKQQPFFLYLPLNSPHTPIVPSPEWQGKSGINTYADFTMQTDHCVGEILQALDSTGLAKNTLIIFTSDNGCSPSAKFDELLAAGHDPSFVFRGHKADVFEGGHRIPFLVRWPGVVAPGSKSDQLTGQWDLLATCAELTNNALPQGSGADSVSFLPALRGETAKGRESLVSQSINGSFAIRRGPWKLCVCPDSGGWSEPRPGRKNQGPLPDVQLYHLGEDPGESINRAAAHPKVVTELRSLLETIVGAAPNDVPVAIVKS